ncbi:MAG TPA: hypothetical protein VF062_16030, partial [Candidatus Limnocylindrales bacterium]
MRLDITPVKGSDDTAIRAWCEVTTAAVKSDTPLWRVHTPEMVRGWMETNYPGDHTEGFLARAGGQAV